MIIQQRWVHVGLNVRMILIFISYPSKTDGWVMHDLLRNDVFKEFKDEVKERGYDIETLRISVKLKK
ncbi:hypothetical protein ACQKNX_07910 [Lysinibacillus sp. NPDC093712]|uniref:hypothetical protein n=1 Tax=Lysinibacillus sp. NPDC093712 TaxID=3390579 RepID=UPI003CFC2050